MDYKQKYENAIELAREIIKSYENRHLDRILFYIKEDLQSIFPELKENEDERIRKVLVDFFKDYIKNTSMYLENVDVHAILAWLEKQREVKHTCRNCQTFQDLHPNCPYSPIYQCTDLTEAHRHLDDETHCEFWIEKQGEQKHKFVIGDIISNGKIIYRVDNIVKNCVGQECYFLVDVETEKNGTRYHKLTNSEGKTYNAGEITWLCEQVDEKFEKQSEQKPTECIRELKPNGGIVYEDFNDGDGYYKVDLAYLSKSQVELIENLVTSWQNPTNNTVKWSEEDVEMIDLLISILEINHPDAYFKSNDKDDVNMRAVPTKKIINWLKSLRERMKGE